MISKELETIWKERIRVFRSNNPQAPIVQEELAQFMEEMIYILTENQGTIGFKVEKKKEKKK